MNAHGMARRGKARHGRGARRPRGRRAHIARSPRSPCDKRTPSPLLECAMPWATGRQGCRQPASRRSPSAPQRGLESASRPVAARGAKRAAPNVDDQRSRDFSCEGSRTADDVKGRSYMEKVKRTLSAILGFAAVVASSIITTSVAVAIEPLPLELFGSVDPRLTTPSQAKSTPFDEMAKRRRVASIDFGMLDRVRGAVAGGSESAAVRLNLFDDVSVDGFIERTAPTFSGGYSLSGHIVDDLPGSVNAGDQRGNGRGHRTYGWWQLPASLAGQRRVGHRRSGRIQNPVRLSDRRIVPD